MDHETVIKNAVIEQVDIIARNETAAMFELVLDYADSSQATGKYPTTEDALGRLLNICGVESWAKLRGCAVRVRVSRQRIVALGHVIKDKWLVFDNQIWSST